MKIHSIRAGTRLPYLGLLPDGVVRGQEGLEELGGRRHDEVEKSNPTKGGGGPTPMIRLLELSLTKSERTFRSGSLLNYEVFPRSVCHARRPGNSQPRTAWPSLRTREQRRENDDEDDDGDDLSDDHTYSSS